MFLLRVRRRVPTAPHEVAFRFEFTRKLADWKAAGGEVVGGEWKKEWRNLSLFGFYFLVTVLAALDSGLR